MSNIKIGVCCTFGVGSSMLLKGNLETVFRKLNEKVEIEVSDISNVNAMNFNVIFTSASLVSQVESSAKKGCLVIPVYDYFNMAELEKGAKKAIEEVK